MPRWSRFIVLVLLVSCKPERLVTRFSAAKWDHPVSLQKGSDDVIQCSEAALQPVLRSETNKEAIDNISTAMPSSNAIIAGHGNVGFICTGPAVNGAPCPAIGWWNDSEWSPVVADKLQKKHLGKIVLLGCGVGSSDIGRDLLVAFAKSAQCSVRAPTDLVHCEDGVIQLTGSKTWREADKDGNVTTDTTPQFDFGDAQSIAFDLDRVRQRVPWRIPLVHVEELRVQRSFDRPDFETIPKTEAEPLVRTIDFAHPFKLGGAPLATITGTIDLRIALPLFPIRRTFLIYSDQIAQDPDHPTLFYRIGSRFTNAARERRRNNTPVVRP